MSQLNLSSNGHKFPYGATVYLKNFPKELGKVTSYSSGDGMITEVYVEFKVPGWFLEEDLEWGITNPSRRDSH